MINNIAWRLYAYQDNNKELLTKIPLEQPTPNLEYFKRKCQTIFTDIGGGWYLNNILNNKPPTNILRLNKKTSRIRWKIQLGKIGNSKLIGNFVNMLCQSNAILLRLPFVCPLNIFLKYELQDNHWVGNFVMKQTDSVACHKIKLMIEGNNDKSKNFEIKIIEEGVLDKACGTQ